MGLAVTWATSGVAAAAAPNDKARIAAFFIRPSHGERSVCAGHPNVLTVTLSHDAVNGSEYVRFIEKPWRRPIYESQPRHGHTTRPPTGMPRVQRSNAGSSYAIPVEALPSIVAQCLFFTGIPAIDMELLVICTGRVFPQRKMPRTWTAFLFR